MIKKIYTKDFVVDVDTGLCKMFSFDGAINMTVVSPRNQTAIGQAMRVGRRNDFGGVNDLITEGTYCFAQAEHLAKRAMECVVDYNMDRDNTNVKHVELFYCLNLPVTRCILTLTPNKVRIELYKENNNGKGAKERLFVADNKADVFEKLYNFMIEYAMSDNPYFGIVG